MGLGVDDDQEKRAWLIWVVFLQAVVVLFLVPSSETQMVGLFGIILIDSLSILSALVFKLNDLALRNLILVLSIVLWIGIVFFM